MDKKIKQIIEKNKYKTEDDFYHLIKFYVDQIPNSIILRQKRILNYKVDILVNNSIIIELNGSYHYISDTTVLRDSIRRQKLESLGFKVKIIPFCVYPTREIMSRVLEFDLKIDYKDKWKDGFYIARSNNLPGSFSINGFNSCKEQYEILTKRSFLDSCQKYEKNEDIERFMKNEKYIEYMVLHWHGIASLFVPYPLLNSISYWKMIPLEISERICIYLSCLFAPPTEEIVGLCDSDEEYDKIYQIRVMKYKDSRDNLDILRKNRKIVEKSQIIFMDKNFVFLKDGCFKSHACT